MTPLAEAMPEMMYAPVSPDVQQAGNFLGILSGEIQGDLNSAMPDGIPANHDCTICIVDATSCTLLQIAQENDGNNPFNQRMKAVELLKTEDPNVLARANREALIQQKMQEIQIVANNKRSAEQPKPQAAELPQHIQNMVKPVEAKPHPTTKKAVKPTFEPVIMTSAASQPDKKSNPAETVSKNIPIRETKQNSSSQIPEKLIVMDRPPFYPQSVEIKKPIIKTEIKNPSKSKEAQKKKKQKNIQPQRPQTEKPDLKVTTKKDPLQSEPHQEKTVQKPKLTEPTIKTQPPLEAIKTKPKKQETKPNISYDKPLKTVAEKTNRQVTEKKPPTVMKPTATLYSFTSEGTPDTAILTPTKISEVSTITPESKPLNISVESVVHHTDINPKAEALRSEISFDSTDVIAADNTPTEVVNETSELSDMDLPDLQVDASQFIDNEETEISQLISDIETAQENADINAPDRTGQEELIPLELTDFPDITNDLNDNLNIVIDVDSEQPIVTELTPLGEGTLFSFQPTEIPSIDVNQTIQENNSETPMVDEAIVEEPLDDTDLSSEFISTDLIEDIVESSDPIIDLSKPTNLDEETKTLFTFTETEINNAEPLPITDIQDTYEPSTEAIDTINDEPTIDNETSVKQDVPTSNEVLSEPEIEIVKTEFVTTEKSFQHQLEKHLPTIKPESILLVSKEKVGKLESKSKKKRNKPLYRYEVYQVNETQKHQIDLLMYELLQQLDFLKADKELLQKTTEIFEDASQNHVSIQELEERDNNAAAVYVVLLFLLKIYSLIAQFMILPPTLEQNNSQSDIQL
ncbi:MAG: hypothetical protein ACEQSA_02530 [Weeksellaceae bacterium]